MILRLCLIGLLAIAAPEEGIADQGDETPPHKGDLVDLTSREKSSLASEGTSGHVLSNPWWQNFDIHGFGAAGLYDTGSAGTRDHGGFEIKEASLFIEGAVWEDTAFFVELQTNRLGKDDKLFTRTGEVYVHFRDLPVGETSLGVKVGRIDIPFGEEYLWQDAVDNPLITNSAAYPYGQDEGILVYGDLKRVGWIASVTDGTAERSAEENSDKALNLKVSTRPWEQLYLSLSAMSTGDASRSAFEFGGSHLEPVGMRYFSTLGESASTQVSANLFGLDAKYDFQAFHSRPGYVAVSFGTAKQDDVDPAFDRGLRWWSIQPYLDISDKWYGVLRYSGIETDDANEGYFFYGKTFSGVHFLGYDTRRFRRLGAGLGWSPNPHVTAKLEVGKEWVDLIEVSPGQANNGSREFLGFEIAVGF